VTRADSELIGFAATSLAALVSPLQLAATSSAHLTRLLGRIGWKPAAPDPAASEAFARSLDALIGAIHGVHDAIEQDVDATAALASLFRHVAEALRQIDPGGAGSSSVAPETSQALVEDLLEYLILDFVRHEYPILFRLATMFDILVQGQPAPLYLAGGASAASAEDPIVRLPVPRLVLDRTALASLAAAPFELARKIWGRAEGKSGGALDPNRLLAAAGEVIAADLAALGTGAGRDFHFSIDPLGVNVSIPGVTLSDVAVFPVSVPLPAGDIFVLGLGSRAGRLRIEWPPLPGIASGGWTLFDLAEFKLSALAGGDSTEFLVERVDDALRVEIGGRCALGIPAGIIGAPGSASLSARGGATLRWSAAEGARLELGRLEAAVTEARLGDSGVALRDASLTVEGIGFPLPAGGPPVPFAISAEGEFGVGDDGRVAVAASFRDDLWSLSSNADLALGGDLRIRQDGTKAVLSCAFRPTDRKAQLAVAGLVELPKMSAMASLSVAGSIAIEDGVLSGGIGGEVAEWEIAEGLVCETLAFRVAADRTRLRAGLAATIPLGSGFTLAILDEMPPGSSAEPGLTMERRGSIYSAVVSGGIRLTFPPEVLADETGGGASAAAFGTLRLSTDPSRPVRLEDVSLHFRADRASLGDDSALRLEKVDLLVTRVDRLLAAGTAEPRPVATLSGSVQVTADDPEVKVALLVEGAQFIFDAPGDLPRFLLKDGGKVGCSAVLPAAMPLQIRSATMTFLDTDRPITRLFEPDNVIIGFDAELAIGMGKTGGVSAGVEGVTARMLDGLPHLSLEGISLGVQDLELGVATVSGGLGIHNLHDPLNLQVEGAVGGTVFGSGVKVLTALKAVNGFIEPLGACLDVQGGPAGIVLPFGFMVTGASGGISFANTNGSPCDFRTYSGARQPRPAIRPDRSASTTRPQKFEGCDCCDCPPASMNVLCQPHPDQARYPGRVILKFSAIDEPMWTGLPAPDGSGTLGDWVRARDREVAAAGASAGRRIERRVDAAASGLVEALQGLIAGRIGPVEAGALPAAPAGLPAEVAAAMMAPVAAWAEDAKIELVGRIRSATVAVAGEGRLYQAVRDTLYAGVACRDATLQVTGTFSHALVSAFLSVTGGVSVSTAGSIGVIGRLNILSVPVGHLNAFVTGTSATGDPEPQLCGDLRLELGPLQFGLVGAQLRSPGLVTASAGLVARHVCELAPSLLATAVAAIESRPAGDRGRIDRRPGFDLAARPARSLGLLTAGEATGLIANLTEAAAAEGPAAAAAAAKALGHLTAELWEAFQPEFSFCGQAAPRIFGIPLAELARVSGRITKDRFDASVSFSPLYVLGRFSPIANLFSGADSAKLEASMSLPPIGDLGAAALSGRIGSQADLDRFLADGLERILRDAAFTASYELSPLGLSMTESVARLVMPYLTPHPTSRSSKWKNPDRDGGLPSRRDLLFAALDKDRLGSSEWDGDVASVIRLPAGAGALRLQRDYFPHGGLLGAGRLNVPSLLTEAPPLDLLDRLGTGPTLDRLNAGLDLVRDHILKVHPFATLAFYAPFPNPPPLARDAPRGTDPAGHVRKVHELMSRQGLDPTMIATPSYSADLAFFEGEARGRLLGIDLGRAEVEWVPPTPSTAAGALRVTAAIDDNAWIRSIVEVGLLEFDMKLGPDLAGMDRSARRTLAAAFQGFNARARPGAQSNAAEMLDSLLATAALALPKLSLRSAVRLRTPPQWEEFLSFDADADATIEAYSPFFDPASQGSSPAATARRNGGILLTARLELKLGAAWSLASATTLSLIGSDRAGAPPRLQGEFEIGDARGLSFLGRPLPLSAARLQLDTAPGPGAPFLSLRGGSPSINLGVFSILPDGAAKIEVTVEARPRRAGMALSFRLSPFRIESPLLSRRTPVLLSGAVPAAGRPTRTGRPGGTGQAAPPAYIELGEEGGGAALYAPNGLTLLGAGGTPILAIAGAIRGEAAVDASGRWSLSLALPSGIKMTLLPDDARLSWSIAVASKLSLVVTENGNFTLDVEAPPLALAGDWLKLHGAAGEDAPVKLRITPRGIGLGGPAMLRFAPGWVPPQSTRIEEFALGPGGFMSPAEFTLKLPAALSGWQDAGGVRIRVSGASVQVSSKTVRAKPVFTAQLQGSLRIETKARHEGRPLGTHMDFSGAEISSGIVRLELRKWTAPDLLADARETCRQMPFNENCDKLFPMPPSFGGGQVDLDLSALFKRG
jgi:hypothetical protein